MRVVVRGHPRERMAERQVSMSDIEAVIDNYTHRVSSKSGSATVTYGVPRKDGRVLKVVLVGNPPRTDPYIVKTVAWKDEDDG